MRVLAISDCHADARLFGVSRFDEVEAAMLDSVRVAVERRVDRYLFCGDLCDPDSGVGVFRCVELALRVALALSAAGITSDWLAGNHDVCEDGSGDTTLSPLRALSDGLVHVHEGPGWSCFGEGVSLLALPFTAASEPYDPEEYVARTWGRYAGAGERVVVATHLGIEGVQPGEETRDMPRGRDVLYSKRLVASRNPLAQVAGHYHERQVFEGIQIVGAPARFAFGEKNNEPGFLVLEL